MQASNHADVNDNEKGANYFVGEILAHKGKGKTWQIKGRYDDDKENYESTVEWGDLKGMFSDCIPTVQEQARNEGNLVILYAQDLGNNIPEDLAKVIAGLEQKRLSKEKIGDFSVHHVLADLFPHLAGEEEDIDDSSSLSTVTDQEEECGLAHLEGKEFTEDLLCPVEDKYYFNKEGRKYYGLVCSKCKQVPKHPSMQSPCYVCDLYHKDKVTKCDCVYCHECYTTLLLEKPAGSSKRGRRGAV